MSIVGRQGEELIQATLLTIIRERAALRVENHNPVYRFERVKGHGMGVRHPQVAGT